MNVIGFYLALQSFRHSILFRLLAPSVVFVSSPIAYMVNTVPLISWGGALIYTRVSIPTAVDQASRLDMFWSYSELSTQHSRSSPLLPSGDFPNDFSPLVPLSLLHDVSTEGKINLLTKIVESAKHRESSHVQPAVARDPMAGKTASTSSPVADTDSFR